jgi:hypothetical protein
MKAVYYEATPDMVIQKGGNPHYETHQGSRAYYGFGAYVIIGGMRQLRQQTG